MPYAPAAEDSVFFIRVATLCKGGIVSCSPATPLVEAARLMQRHDVTGLIVEEPGKPAGIFSIRDFRRLVAGSDGNLTGLSVRDGMTAGLITVRDQDCVLDAIFTMARHNIHRLGVTDAGGGLVGLISAVDLLSLQTKSPLYLANEIDAARSLAELRRVSARVLDAVVVATGSGAEIRGVVQLISHFNDAITGRLVQLLEHEEGIVLPDGAAYLVLGSEGRGEQTLRTDQDSAMVYRDDLTPQQLLQVERFAVRIVEALESLGVPRCPGDTMASNPQWRHSISQWRELVGRWITVPKPEHMVNFGMFQDLRAVHGDRSLERQLHEHILEQARQNGLFLVFVARNILRFAPPIGMFGRLKVEGKGEHKGKLDLKKGGIFAVTAGASLLALEAGVVDGTTWDKLELLGKQGILSGPDLETVQDAFSYLVRLRLERQLRALAAGRHPSNQVDPLVMTDKERDRLREALKGVGTFLHIIRDHFQLGLMAR